MNHQITERIMNTLSDNVISNSRGGLMTAGLDTAISGYQGISGLTEQQIEELTTGYGGDGYGHDYSEDYDYNPAYDMYGEGMTTDLDAYNQAMDNIIFPSKYGSFIGDGDIPLDPRRFARSYLINENPNATSAQIKKAYEQRIKRSALSGVKKQAHLNQAKRIKNLRAAGLKQKPHHLSNKKYGVSNALKEGKQKYDNFINEAIQEGNSRKEAQQLWRDYKKLLETDIHLEREPVHIEQEPEFIHEEPVYKKISTQDREKPHILPIYDRDYFKQSLFYVADDLEALKEKIHNLASHIDYL